jgi:hypothetical protein
MTLAADAERIISHVKKNDDANSLRKAEATKKARYRRRLRDGIWICPVEMSRELIEYLLWLGAITEAESESRKQIGKGIRELLADAMAHDEEFKRRII